MPALRTDLDGIARMFSPGDTVYLQGAVGETLGLRSALADEPDRLAGVRLTGCLLPGINDFDYAALHADAQVETFMAAPHLRATIDDGRTRVIPLSYSQIDQRFSTLAPDIAVVMVTPPENGLCSLGTCADFGESIARSARRLVGVVNAAMPQPLRSSTLSLDAFHALADVHEVRHSPEERMSAELTAIGRHVAALTPDGAFVETGIGAAPAAVWTALKDHRDLTLYSGMVSDGFVVAARSGAIRPTGHVAGFAYGGAQLTELLDRSDLVAFAGVRTTHDVAALGKLERFIAINSALEVDLFGQVNLEWRGGRCVSGVGGAPDFGRGAQLSPGGRSIIALPATANGGEISRIRLRLSHPASLSRTEVDTVVTEFGAAELRGRTAEGRAEALIAIAAPRHRDRLADEWRRECQSRERSVGE